MQYTADEWIKKCWIGIEVQQFQASPGMEQNIGRKARVTDAFFDENRKLHVHTDDGFWCPATLLHVLG